MYISQETVGIFKDKDHVLQRLGDKSLPNESRLMGMVCLTSQNEGGKGTW